MPAASYLEGKSRTVFDGIGGDVLSAGLLLTEGRLKLIDERRFRQLAQDIIGQSSRDALIRSRMRVLVSREVALDRIVTELKRHEEASNPLSSFVF